MHNEFFTLRAAPPAELPPAAAHAVTLIQAQARGWLVRKHISQHGRGLQPPSTKVADQQQAAAAAAEAQQRDLQRQLHPKTAADFAFLREKVRQWMAQVTTCNAACMTNSTM